MKKYIVGYLMFCAVLQTYTMKKPVNLETKEEFIQRTKPYEEALLEFCREVRSFDRTKEARISLYWNQGPRVCVMSKHNNIKFEILNLGLPAEWKYTTTVDFNKQGTHLLVRGVYYDKNGKLQKERMMIPLGFAEQYKESVVARYKK